MRSGGEASDPQAVSPRYSALGRSAADEAPPPSARRRSIRSAKGRGRVASAPKATARSRSERSPLTIQARCPKRRARRRPSSALSASGAYTRQHPKPEACTRGLLAPPSKTTITRSVWAKVEIHRKTRAWFSDVHHGVRTLAPAIAGDPGSPSRSRGEEAARQGPNRQAWRTL